MPFYFYIFFLKKLSLKKLFNAVKAYSSYLLSVLFKKTNRFAYPISISVEPTAACNLKCPECPSGNNTLKRTKGDMDFALFKKIIDEFSPYLINLILYFQGEPFLNKEIFRFTEYASKKKKIFTTTSTNGHFIDVETSKKIVLSGLDKIIISVDGVTQKTYEKYRKNGNLNKVIEGIKNLAEQRSVLKSKTPFIVMQFIVFRFNEHEIKSIKKLAKMLKVDKLELKSAQIYNFEKNTQLIPTLKQYSRYKKNKHGKIVIKNKLRNKCNRLWISSVITNTGDVLPCCFDKDAKYSAGNMKNISFKEINNNNFSRGFRKRISEDRKQIDICRNCTEGLRV